MASRKDYNRMRAGMKGTSCSCWLCRGGHAKKAEISSKLEDRDLQDRIKDALEDDQLSCPCCEWTGHVCYWHEELGDNYTRFERDCVLSRLECMNQAPATERLSMGWFSG